MPQNGSKLHQMAPNCSKSLQQAPNGFKWLNISLNVSKSLQIAPNEDRNEDRFNWKDFIPSSTWILCSNSQSLSIGTWFIGWDHGGCIDWGLFVGRCFCYCVLPGGVFGHGPVIYCGHVFAAHPDCGILLHPPVAGLFGYRLSLLRACIIAVAIVLIALVVNLKVCFCMFPGFHLCV